MLKLDSEIKKILENIRNKIGYENIKNIKEDEKLLDIKGILNTMDSIEFKKKFWLVCFFALEKMHGSDDFSYYNNYNKQLEIKVNKLEIITNLEIMIDIFILLKEFLNEINKNENKIHSILLIEESLELISHPSQKNYFGSKNFKKNLNSLENFKVNDNEFITKIIREFVSLFLSNDW